MCRIWFVDCKTGPRKDQAITAHLDKAGTGNVLGAPDSVTEQQITTNAKAPLEITG